MKTIEDRDKRLARDHMIIMKEIYVLPVKLKIKNIILDINKFLNFVQDVKPL